MTNIVWFEVSVYNLADDRPLNKSGAAVSAANFEFYLSFKAAGGYTVREIANVSVLCSIRHKGRILLCLLS